MTASSDRTIAQRIGASVRTFDERSNIPPADAHEEYDDTTDELQPLTSSSDRLDRSDSSRTPETIPYGGASSPVVENCLVLLTVYSTMVGLYMLADVMIPLVMALFVSTLLLPLLDLLTERPARCFSRVWCARGCGACLSIEDRYPNICCRTLTSILTLRLPTALGLAIALGAVGAAISGVFLLVQKSVVSFADDLPSYESALKNETTRVLAVMDSMPYSPTNEQRQQLVAFFSDGLAISSLVLSIFTKSTTIVMSFALVMLYTTFILLGSPKSAQRESKKVLYSIECQLQLYVTWKVIISVGAGLLHTAILMVSDVPLATLFGVATILVRLHLLLYLDLTSPPALRLSLSLPFCCSRFENLSCVRARVPIRP